MAEASIGLTGSSVSAAFAWMRNWRAAENVAPKVNHWIPDATAKSVGAAVDFRIPPTAPASRPPMPVD